MIAKPALTGTGGVHQLVFTDERLDVQVDRLADHKQETTGELRITSRRPEQWGHIHQARLNLTSSVAKVRLGKDLAERCEFLMPNDWRDLIEYVAVMVLGKHREGEPPIHLADYAPGEGLKWRVWPFLQERQATVLFGEGDTGKSWLALLMAYQCATGQSVLDMDVEPGRALYLDYETDEDTLWDRVNQLSAGLGEAPPDGLWYRRMYGTVASDFQALSQIVLEHGINLIVVDSAAPATGEPENSGPTTEYFRALRGLGCTSLTIAHVSKTGADNSPFGSQFWRNQPRANFRVHADHEAGAKAFTMGLRHTKANNGPRQKDRAYRFAFGADSVTVDRAEAMEIATIEETAPLYQRMEAALRDGAMSPNDLADHIVGADVKQVANALSRWKGSKFQPIERGLWGLAARA